MKQNEPNFLNRIQTTPLWYHKRYEKESGNT
jgi:hypothetical protein